MIGVITTYLFFFFWSYNSVFSRICMMLYVYNDVDVIYLVSLIYSLQKYLMEQKCVFLLALYIFWSNTYSLFDHLLLNNIPLIFLFISYT